MNQVSKSMVVKNRRLKMSPSGIITLPVSARKALHMEKGQGHRITIAIENSTVILTPTNETGGCRVSPKGQLQLKGDAYKIITDGVGRHYWMELDNESGRVALNPFH